MSFVVLVGSTGRMSKELQSVLSERKIAFKIYGANPAAREISDFNGSLGVIDFSLPAATPDVLDLAMKAKVPVVCGTTGWKDPALFEKIFSSASKKIPLVWDSNFSLGIELLCQSAEILSNQTDGPFQITDIHHIHKKDAPSGTALKIQKRIQEMNPKAKVTIESIREGENPGEHRIQVELENESLEFTHRARDRKIFAVGALKAFEWLQDQPAGLYSMKDVLS